MLALEEVVVGFVRAEAMGAPVVVARFAVVKALADGEFFPAEFGEEWSRSGELRVNGVKEGPVDAPKSGVGPSEAC